LEFYDTLTNVLNVGFVFRMKLCSGEAGTMPDLDGTKDISARFMSKRHLDKFLGVIIDEEVHDYEQKYH